MKTVINGIQYSVFFHHKTKLGKRARLHRGPVKAVTTCTIVAQNAVKILFVATDVAICVDQDNFSRRQGRLRSFISLVKHCGPLRDVGVELYTWYQTVDARPESKRPDLTADQKAVRTAEFISAGAEKRAKRAAAKTGKAGA